MFARLFDPQVRVQATTWGTWPGDAPTTSWAGQSVTPESALQLLTVYGCVRLITDSISTLPVDCYRKVGDDKAAIPLPLWLQKPTVDLDFTAWCTQVLSSLLLHGNCYLAVTRNDSMQIVEVVPLDPCKVVVRRAGVQKQYWINNVLSSAEIVHIKGMMLAGSDVGMSPIEYARQSIGLGLAALDFGSKGFDNEWNMPGVIEFPKPVQPELLESTAKAWQKKRSKGGRGLPGVLQEGATWKQTGVTNEQAQFLATRQWTAAEIAGQVFMVDPSDLGIPVVGSSLTYANLEQRNIRRLQVTLLPWIVRVEAAVSALMANPRYMKLNTNALLRADLKTRYESYAIGLAGQPFLEDSEPRAWEDLPPAFVAPLPEMPPKAKTPHLA